MSRSFNGTTDQITTVATPTTQGADVTISCWFNAVSLSATTMSFFVGDAGASARGYGLMPRNGNSVSGGIVPGVAYINAGGGLASTGAWHHLLMLTNTGGNSIAYLDGVSASRSGGVTGPNAGDKGYIGFDGSVEFFNGMLADIALWTISLSAGEIGGLVQGARPGKVRPANLKLWLPLFGNVSPEPDLSGNANNGTLTGTSAGTSDPPLMMQTTRWPQPAPLPPPPVFNLMPQIVT